MKFFLDTEFIESGPDYLIYPLSFALVAEDGREYYAVVKDAPLWLASDWVWENVIKYLDFSIAKPREVIAEEIVKFVGQFPTIWGYYSDYDWVVLCQSYGTMMDLPNSWPKYCLDLKQLAIMMGNPKLPELPGKQEHHALWDAREMKYRYEWLMEGHNNESRTTT